MNRVCVPMDATGEVGHGWGRSELVVVAETAGPGAGFSTWEEHRVRWDELHDTDGDGAHHARVARFLREHAVDTVVARGMGPSMRHMLETMGVRVLTGDGTTVRDVATSAVVHDAPLPATGPGQGGTCCGGGACGHDGGCGREDRGARHGGCCGH